MLWLWFWLLLLFFDLGWGWLFLFVLLLGGWLSWSRAAAHVVKLLNLEAKDKQRLYPDSMERAAMFLKLFAMMNGIVAEVGWPISTDKPMMFLTF